MKKVIIIGAGPAGITAGYELMKQSNEYEVTILEETPYVGGISRTECHNGHRMDIGGHRFFSKSQEVNDWWENIMPMQGAPAYDDDKLNRDVPLSKGGPNPEKEDCVMLNRSRISHIYYNRKFFEYPVKMNMDTIKNMGFGTTMQAGFSYLGSMVTKKPESSLENFYINQFGKKLYSMFFEGYTEKLWGRHPREIDPSWGAQRTKGLSITEIVKDATRKAFHKEAKEVNTSLIGAFKYPKLGPGQLWETAAAKFEEMGGSIHYNCRVIRINIDGNQVESVTCAVDGITIEEKADIVISSMPIKDLIVGMSGVPANVTEVARKLPYRDFVTVGLLVPKLRISNTTYMRTLGNVIPDTWIYVQDTGVKMGRIQIFNNWSPYLVENPEKTVWIGLEYFCNEGDRYWNMTDDEWIQFATKELVQMGILSESTKVLDAHKVAMKKAYPAYFDSYSRFDEVRTFLDGFENLYCIGRNGQHRYNNMDHSMITAFETVKNILSGEKDKSNIWNVNTEQEYHEEKVEVKEEKDVTATPVPAVKEEIAPVEAVENATPMADVPETKEKPAKQEEEIKAAVKAVPAPPVRKQLRRNPVPKAVAEEPVQATEIQPVDTEEVIPEAELHVSKSRSIWDDVAYAEATAEVKTVPIRFKSVEEAHAAVKGTAVEKVSAPKEDEKHVAEKEETATDVKEEVVAVKEEKKKTRTKTKKATPTVTEEVKEEVPEKAIASEEVKEEKPKKTTRGRKKKTEVVAEKIPAVEEAKPEETPAVEEAKPEETPAVEEAKAAETPVVEEVKAEEIQAEPEKKEEPEEEEKAEEVPVTEEEKAEEPRRHAHSTSGKTIAGRSSSRRVSDRNSSRRKVEEGTKKASNVGKEAVFGNMKGTVIKSNVIQKTPEETKKTTGSGRR